MYQKFENLEKQRDDVYKALCGNGMTYDVAVWLSDLHVRMRECEKALLMAGLASLPAPPKEDKSND